ncbi:MAG: hypothetical protein R3C26_26315 [Calditrichia bacterium]
MVSCWHFLGDRIWRERVCAEESEAVGEVKRTPMPPKSVRKHAKRRRVAQKQQLAQQFIITDGHIDIPIASPI